MTVFLPPSSSHTTLWDTPLSYGKIKVYFPSRGYRERVEIHQVNSPFSSVIGRVKFMERYGPSVHQLAGSGAGPAFARLLRRIPLRWVSSIGNGVQVAFTVPVRKRVKHSWTYWGAILGQLRPALAAQHRLGKRRRRPNPVQAAPRMASTGTRPVFPDEIPRPSRRPNSARRLGSHRDFRNG